MIVLDTNVWSEPLKASPAPQVLAWMADHAAEAALTTITIGELRYSTARMPKGRRHLEISAAIDGLINQSGRRLLPLDGPAAQEYANARHLREAAGRPITVEDAMIAGICRCRGIPLATRNTDDFADLDIELINPWENA